MKVLKYFLLLNSFIAGPRIFSHAQDIFSWTKEKEYCNPSVIGLPRAKAAIIKYELQPAYNIRSEGKSGNYGDSEGKIGRNRRFDVRLRFPIVHKSSLTIAAGLKYSQEEFSFSDDQPVNYSFYQDLEDRPLKSAGIHFYMVKPTKNKKYFILRTSFDLNGDYGSDKFGKSEFLKFSITPLIGWKQNENLSYAVGFTYGYSFGVPLIVPVFSYNKNFNCNFGIESVLPLSLKLRYTKNEKNYWYGGVELGGASYRLDNEGTAFSNYNKLHLFRSELRYTVNYEREIHDWLWFSIEGGYRQNLRFNLTNGPRGSSDVIISNKLKGAPVINASIFVVPPRFFLKKAKQ
jgi:Domain of unknown function (DUF6268)